MRLTVEEIDERNRLESLAKKGRLYCTKHDIPIGRGLFWKKRCYSSRDKKRCEYLIVRGRNNGKRNN